jgi:hypothetical protein
MKNLLKGLLPVITCAALACVCSCITASAYTDNSKLYAGVFSWSRNGSYADATLSNTSGSTRWLEVGVYGATKTGNYAGSDSNQGAISSGAGSIWAGTASLLSTVYTVEHYGVMRNNSNSTSGIYETWTHITFP